MKARVEWKWATDTYSVWLYDRPSEAGVRVLKMVGPDQWEWQEVSEGSLTEPSLTLPPGALEQIVAEAGDVLPPSGQMAEHLKDARTVRDRLLAMIEKRGIR